MFSSQTQDEASFNSTDFNSTLRHFVPPPLCLKGDGISLSQVFIISLQVLHEPSSKMSEVGLKLPTPHETYDLYHPVSMYEELFNGSPISNTSMSLKRTSTSERTRRFSVAERAIEKPSRHHFRLRGSTKSKSPNHEQKLPKKASRVMSHQYQQRKYSRSATLPSNPSLEGDTTFYSGDAKSREDVRLCAQTLEENLMLEEALQSPFIAVDKRLAERLQHQSVINTDPIGINKKSQLSPSYLILYAPVQDASEAEAMELHPLQICVRWTVGCRPKVSPTTGLVIDTGVPKKPRFCASSFMPSENMRSVKKRSVSRVEKPDLKPTWRERKYSRASKSSILTRSTSVPGKRDSILSPDCIYVLPKKLSAQCLRFAFSRCHTILEVCEAIARNFTDYCNRDLTTDSYRLWFVDSPESADSPSQRPKMSQITKTVSASSDTTDSDDDEGDGSSGGTLLAKRVCLAPINPNAIGGQQLGRFLANQDPSSQVCADIFDPYGKCPKTFEFVIECLQQNYYWPLGQCPNEAGNFVGLKNMGNTCYFNSVIQCLRATPYLERQIRMRVTPQNKLANEYVKLLDQMKQERWVNPRSLRQVFVQKMPAFGPFVQQDAHEFLTLFIDLLNEELKHKPTSPKNGTLRSEDNRKRSVYTKKIFSASKQNVFRENNDSPITSIFSGLCESQCQFDECRHNSSSFDIFASLTLPLSVDEVSYIILTVVPSHDAVPEMVRFENDRPITFNFIRQQVSRRYKCSLDQVFLALYNDKALTPLLPSSTESEKVVNKFDYWAFILPPSRPGSPIDKEMLVVVQNRILVPSSSPLLEEVPDEREVLGSPIVLLLPLNTTNKELYNTVEKAINSNPGDEKFFFVLKQTGKHLWRCSKCRWPKMCRGCPIPYNSEKVSFQPSANGCVYIAADWSLDVYINEYRQAQDVIWKKIDKVGHTGSNSKDALQLTNLLRKFFEEEVVNQSDSILCDLCHKKESFTMYTNICELPEVLLISFKRFHATNHGWRKSSNLVDFPLTSLDMRAYLSKDVNCNNTLYDLYAVVNHTGKLDEGHYYAFIRNEGGHWFRVNDTQFSEVRKESVVTSDAYILFYQQRQSG
ncbi:unnamed protein product [Hydatigera taeniaeformis]|uniref:ubiquitinyl hydrolase 1 n=1 Tax=Hydatigena taeniaeformis TaxID=6205 RepID=A0A158RF25_HYDTA|nr:unnamed protein product [Hydatigera taeniaeformis]